uniref:Uncharacterized protein n=1 Tax=Anguilla anguilla TaxID=7936 RepID=A0A0E9S977_ANGAN
MPSNKCFYFILHIDNLWFSILSKFKLHFNWLSHFHRT